MAKTLRRRGYHHGNLREALVAAARRLIAARGPAGFTLSEAARQAGVSAAAPYRHFADRDALLAELARRGFAEFDRRLSAAWRGAGAGAAERGAGRDAGAAFLRMGEAYLAFAREEPGYYAAMFAARPKGRRRQRAARSRQAASRQTSFAALERAVTQLATGDLDPRQLAYLVWALSHGIATLAAAGQLPSTARFRPEALLRDGVGALLAGAGCAPGPAPRPRRRH